MCTNIEQISIMDCVEIIKENIGLVETASERKVISAEQAVNKFLDTINDTKKDIEDLTKITDELIELLWKYFDNLNESDFNEFKQQLYRVIDKLNLFYRLVKNSKLYPGVKSVTKEMYYSIENLIEVYSDLITFKTKLPKNKDFLKIVSDINDL